MAKHFSTSLVFISFLLSGIIFTRPLLAQSRTPLIPGSQPGSLRCYMETAEGRTIDLNDLCPKNSAPSRRRRCRAMPNSNNILIRNVRNNGNLLTGEVINQSCESVSDVKVNYHVLDNFGNPLDIGYIPVEPSTIQPRSTATFRGSVASGENVETTFVEWADRRNETNK